MTIATKDVEGARRQPEERADRKRGPETDDRTQTIWALFAERARANPERTALIDGETEVDYRRLAKRASAIAGELAARGIEPGSLVGVCMGRSWELVATLVGILRAGCAYVPLDPGYPRERVRYMLEHSRAKVAVVDGEKSAALCAGVPEILRLSEVGESTDDGPAAPSAGDLAYVIYTSGSTGRPKGVAVEHRNVVAMIRATRALLDDEELAGVLAASSVCFDASVMETLGTLCLGGTVVLAQNALDLLDMPSADRVRTSVLVPSVMQAVITAGQLPDGLRTVVLGGEALKRSLVEQLHAIEPRLRVVNVYGPTEDTVYSTVFEVPVGAETIPIGKPVAGSRAYVLDDSLLPVPAGEPGELYLAGDQLARGYLHDEEATRERFIEPRPNERTPPERLYKTGDLCRWTDDGEIEFLGRVDQQVKIRGFRIELEEIESALETMPGVAGAAATVVDGGGGQQLLVAYVMSAAEAGEAVSSETARAYLAQRLPKYMVPQMVLQLDELPRLPSGKLDRKSLPAPQAIRPRRGGAGASSARGAGSEARRLKGLERGERRAALLAIVRREIASMLSIDDPEQVPSGDSLHDLGLDSLTSVELSSRIGSILGHELPAATVLERSTPAALADHLLGLLDGSSGTPAAEAQAAETREAAETLAGFQAQLRSCYPPFLAAKAPSWSASDKGTLVHELKQLVSRPGDPFCKLVRTGSGQRGIVADVDTDREREAIIWTTNLYLGLNRDPEVIAEAVSATERFGTGMGTSAAASGITDLHLEFEKGFAELVGKPDACLFPTGYTANVGVIAGVLGAGDVVVMDQLCHASIVDGARLCGAKIRTFRHNDAADLEAVLESEASPYRTVLVALEGVYSMGEGAAPVEEIVRTAKRHGALVLVDEAHSFGFYGPKGAGLCAARGVTDEVDFIMTTLSKALGSLGGVIAASEEHVALLKSSARAFIFQASSSPADIAAALAALRRLSEDDTLREKLWDTTAYMRRRFTEAGYDLGSGDTPIVTPHFSDKEKLFAIVNGMFERGVHTSAVTYPIVESGRGRLRFICSAAHTRDDVDKTLAALIAAEREAEEQLRAARERPSDALPERSVVERWAEGFVAEVRQELAAASGPAPDLAVAVELAGGEAITIAVDGGEIAVGAAAAGDLPRCSLRFDDGRGLEALCASEVQGLLAAVLDGSCALRGQVEPFVWLVARLAERQPTHGRPEDSLPG